MDYYKITKKLKEIKVLVEKSILSNKNLKNEIIKSIDDLKKMIDE